MSLQLTIPPNVLYPEPQTLNVVKIATLIGENGSGKSAILHKLFEQKLNGADYDPLRVVTFSSGQNENFSSEFAKHLKRQRRLGEELSLDCFYFDKTWSKLLIFLATTTMRNEKVRAFLKRHNYVDEDNLGLDLSTKLEVKFKVDKKYSELIQDALQKEVSGVLTETIRTKHFHIILEHFIEECVTSDFNFDEPLRKRNISLKAEQVFRIPFRAEESGDDSRISFFINAADNSYFIDQSDAKLHLSRGLELDQLSDGEYQILFLYALLDLLDSDNTLFLLDEADSHLHYENVGNLWSLLKQIKGYAITTTHLLDSITSNDHASLNVIEKGQISESNKLKKLIARLKVLSRAKNIEFEICARIPHLALMDDYNDWEIFKRLAARKRLDVSKIQSICAFKKTSSYKATTENFAEPKIDWTKELSRTDTEFQTSQVFLICDCDEAALNFNANGVQVAGRQYTDEIRSIAWPNNQRVAVHLLAWKRREIKNYLLSYTALSNCGRLAEVNNNSLALDFHLKPNEPGDNDHIRRLHAKDAVAPLINGKTGLDSQKLQEYIDMIPPSEISEDIDNMYNFIADKLA